MLRSFLVVVIALPLIGPAVFGEKLGSNERTPKEEPIGHKVYGLTYSMIDLRLNGNFADALAVAESARELARKWADRPPTLELEIANFAADLSELTGDFERAAKHRQAVVDLRIAAKDDDVLIRTVMREVRFALAATKLDGPSKKRLQNTVQRFDKAVMAAERRRVEEAEKFLRAAIGNDKDSETLLGTRIGSTWQVIGSMHFARGNLSKARDAFAEAATWYRSGHTHGDTVVALALTKLGTVQRRLCEYENARLRLREAFEMLRKTAPEQDVEAAKVLNNLANVLSEMGRDREAKKTIEEGFSLIKDKIPEDGLDRAVFLNNLGRIQTCLGEFEAAIMTHETALAIRHKKLKKNHPDIGISLVGLATARRELRQYDLTLKEIEEALRILRRPEQRDGVALLEAQLVLGSVQCELWNFVDAKDTLRTALDTAHRELPKDHPLVATAANFLGSVELDLGEYAEAKRHFEEAVSIRRFKLSSKHRLLAAALNDFGQLLYLTGEFHDAAKTLKEALEIRKEALPPGHRDTLQSAFDLSVARFYQKEYADAKKHVEEALALRTSTDHLMTGKLLVTLASVLAASGEHRQAIDKCDEALRNLKAVLPEDHPNIATCLIKRGHSALCLGDCAKAAVDLANAMPITEKMLLRLATAQSEIDQLAATAKYRWNRDLLLSTTSDLATVYSFLLRAKGAVTDRQRFLRLTRSLDDPKVLALVSELGRVNGALSGSAYEARLRGTSSEEQFVASLAALVAKRTQLESELSRKSKEYQAYLSQAASGPADVRAALARLPQKVALIDIVEYEHVTPPAKDDTETSGEMRLIAFVTRADRKGVTAVRLGKSDDLTDLIERWRARYASRGKVDDTKPDPGEQLREKLWLKLEPHLGGAKLVIVSQDGPLSFLPLAALPGANKSQFLIHEEYTFVTVTVPQRLPELLREPYSPPKPTVLFVGGARFGDAPKVQRESDRMLPVFSPLPGTADEIMALEKLHAKWSVSQMMSGSQGCSTIGSR